MVETSLHIRLTDIESVNYLDERPTLARVLYMRIEGKDCFENCLDQVMME